MGILLRLAGYALRISPFRLVLAYVCLIGSTLLSLAIPRLLGISIDTVLESGDSTVLIWLAATLLVISLAAGAFHYGQTYFSEYISQHVAYRLRHNFLARLQHLSYAFHDRHKTGDLMSRAAADVESIRWFVSFGLIYSVHILTLLVAVSVLLITISWDLGLLGLAAVPVAVNIAVAMTRRFRRMWREVQEDTGRMSTVLQENLSGMRVVKTFGAEERQMEKFGEAATVVSEKTFAVSRLHAANSSLLNMLFTLVTALVVWYGGSKIINGYDAGLGLFLGLTPGELTQFVLYMGLLVFPIRMSGWVVNNFARAIAAGTRIFYVIDAQSPVQEKENAQRLERAEGRVSFEAVRFHYGPPLPSPPDPLSPRERAGVREEANIPSPLAGEGQGEGESDPLSPRERAGVREEKSIPSPLAGEGQGEGESDPLSPRERAGVREPEVLRNINLTIEPGQRVAVLGAPGSGKSAMVSLIPRFYDVTSGRITLDNVDVRDLNLRSLRRNVAIVPQDVFLFAATIRENIAYGAPNAPLEDVIEAARSAQIHDFIDGLPDKYETLVGERGITLSGGQRQRVALARTLLMDPPVLLLDDSTSSVDVDTEALIQRALEEVMKGRTTIAITHRMSAVTKADLVLVMEGGRIVERGAHEELMALNGLYREIYRIQLEMEGDLADGTWAGDGADGRGRAL